MAGEKDLNRYYVKEWGRRESDSEMFCTLCFKKFSIVKGFLAITQHVTYKKHQNACKTMLAVGQLKLSIERPETAGPSTSVPSNMLKMSFGRDGASKAELMWV